MLEWLKTILGDTYTDAVDGKISAEIGKGFVAKADFNAVKTELTAAKNAAKDRDTQLETLKKSTGDVDALKQQITDLQAENTSKDKKHAEEMKSLKMETAVDLALTAAKAKNNTAAKALMKEFLDKAELSDDGTVKGLDEAVKKLSSGADTAFLFEKQEGTKFKGAKPAESGGGQPPARDDPSKMNYDELCAYMAEHPDAKLE